ncbi:MAG: endopeptidase La [Clostridia bacterium]|nr:endopeptidase La [Clostridia bacterium]
MANTRKNYTLPLIPVRGLVVFPFMVLHFDVAREKSIAALEAAMKHDQLVMLSAQKNIAIEEPGLEDIYEIGCIAKVKQMLKVPGGTIRVLVEGVKRAKITKIDFESEEFLLSTVRAVESEEALFEVNDYDATVRRIHELLKKVSQLSGQINIDVINNISLKDDPGQMVDSIATNVFVKVEDKQAVLEELSVAARVVLVINILSREAEVYEIEQKIAMKTKKQIDKNQKDYLLREQMKVIKTELGEDGEEEDEYYKLLEESDLPDDMKNKVEKEIKRLSGMPFGTAEISVIKQWLDTVFELPWKDEELNEPSLSEAMEILENDHYGLNKVKERIVEYLAVRHLSGNTKGPIICLYGPPGVGKTSIAKSIARATGREYVRMSLGGVRDEAEIRGHRKTYVGAMPGRIINAVKQAKSKNALILLDEIDKLGSDFKGDPASAMLEVLDGAQNFAFRDHYLELPYDLSKVLFITTANNLQTIPHALLDRLEVIEITGYTNEEKMHIAKNYLIPRQMEENGLKKGNIRMGDEVIETIIEGYTKEAGVRNLEREIGTVMRKAATSIVTDGRKAVSVTNNNLKKFLGVRKFQKDILEHENPPGVVTGLAWTSLGGVTLTIEVGVMEGTGKIELTGSLGDVMKESARAAVSYIRSRAEEYGIDKEFYKKKDIHIHVPEGATPKDGPSAGITMVTAIVSALTGKSAKADVAMTGEVTLTGRVLAIGGLKEKMLAAYRAGAKTVIIPYENKKDLEEIPSEVLSSLKVIPVKHVSEVTDKAIGNFPKKAGKVEIIPSESDKRTRDMVN